MGDLLDRIGVVVNRVGGVNCVIDAARSVEALGFGASWLTSGGPEDCVALMAAIARSTTRVRLGTSVLQTYPRHPYVVATEANVLDQLAPGRVRLGLGPSHAAVMETLGIAHEHPLTNLSEYVTVVRNLLAHGSVSFEGSQYRVHADLGRRVEVPVLVGALQPATFRLAGSISDGAITWLCPPGYLRDLALPMMAEAADAADRARPPLVAHVAACVHERAEEVREAVRGNVPNVAFPSYQRMLAAAGFPEATGGRWTDDLVDGIIAWGDQSSVCTRIEELFASGADEVLVRPIGAGSDPTRVVEHTIEAIADAFRPSAATAS